MRKKTCTLLLAGLTLLGSAFAQDPIPYAELPLGSITPRGWLRAQLAIMRNGSTGRLDELHPKIGVDNGWLGLPGDGWEETPYWLDGAVPLAHLLDDAALKKKVMRYINWTLDHQRPSGYFGPLTKKEREQGVQITAENCDAGEDWWPKMIMLKVLKQHFEATGDPRVVPFMQKFFAYQAAALDKCPIGRWTEWAAARGADNAMLVLWLYERTNDPSLLELAARIESQSYPWSDWLGSREWVMWAAANQTFDRWMRRHCVNVGMGLKAPVVKYTRTRDPGYLEALKTGWRDLMMLHGLPMGIYSGDEDLHGNAPTQGIELCAIVESMFSMEKIIPVTGDIEYMDALERMAFNALPAQTRDTFMEKQYFQVANQVQISKGVFDFSLPFDREMNNVLGLRSGYTCCTSNMHQGWAKFASHLWYRSEDGGLAALLYSPCEVKTTVGDKVNVTIREETNYPFEEEIRFEILTEKSVAFPLHLRIPAWCREASLVLNGKPLGTENAGRIVRVERTWKNGDRISLKLTMDVTTSNWGRNSRSIERGPLVYALKLGERWEKGSDEKEGEYYSVFPTSAWNYGLLRDVVNDPAAHLKVKVKAMHESFKWNLANAPVEISAPARMIPGWQAVNGVAHQPVTDRNGVYKGEVGEEVKWITLVPYGFTKVRIVAFPVVP